MWMVRTAGQDEVQLARPYLTNVQRCDALCTRVWIRTWREKMRLGCSPKAFLESVEASWHSLMQLSLALAVSLCPTCCWRPQRRICSVAQKQCHHLRRFPGENIGDHRRSIKKSINRIIRISKGSSMAQYGSMDQKGSEGMGRMAQDLDPYLVFCSIQNTNIDMMHDTWHDADSYCVGVS